MRSLVRPYMLGLNFDQSKGLLTVWLTGLPYITEQPFFIGRCEILTPYSTPIFEGLHCYRKPNFMYKVVWKPLILLLWEMAGYVNKVREEELTWRAKSGFLYNPDHFNDTVRQTQKPTYPSHEHKAMGQMGCLIISRLNWEN